MLKNLALSIADASLGLATTDSLAADGTFETSVTVPEGTTLDVKTGSGSIKVSTGSGRDVTITGKIHVRKSFFWRKAPGADDTVAAVPGQSARPAFRRHARSG